MCSTQHFYPIICNWLAYVTRTYAIHYIDKSRYFAITEFNNCVIIRSLRLFFIMNIFGKWRDLSFSSKSDRKKEKSVVSFTHEQNIICCQIKLDDVAYEQTIICMQLFACHVVGCRPMKRKKKLHRMTMVVVFLLLLRKCYRDMFVACVYNDNVLQVLRAIRLTSVTQSVYFGFLSNGV